MYAKFFAAAALLAAPLVKATGDAIVDNQCTFPVYLWSVSSTSGPMVTVPSGGNYSEQYRTNSNGGGISIKIASESDQNAGITQFEYTLAGTIWYDISNINGYPFENWGVTLIPSDSTCTTKLCAAGITECSDAYNQPDDNLATADCSSSADLVLVLCSGQQGNVPVSSVSTVSASATKASSVSSTIKASSTSSTTAHQTSTTVKTSGTTFVTKTTTSSVKTSSSTTTSAASVITAAAVVVAATSTDDNEVIITEFVTSWVTVGGADATSTEAAAAATSTAASTTTQAASTTQSQHQHGHHTFAARSEERRHVHRHARDVVA